MKLCSVGEWINVSFTQKNGNLIGLNFILIYVDFQCHFVDFSFPFVLSYFFFTLLMISKPPPPTIEGAFGT